MLRKYPGKSVASIYDALVDPPEPSTDDSLTVGELARAHEFAKFATNTSAITEIERIASGWGISPDEMNPRDGLEADDEQ